MNAMVNLLNMLKYSNPKMLYDQMMRTNPKFKEFVEQNEGKSAEEIANEHGIDMNLLQQFMK